MIPTEAIHLNMKNVMTVKRTADVYTYKTLTITNVLYLGKNRFPLKHHHYMESNLPLDISSLRMFMFSRNSLRYDKLTCGFGLPGSTYKTKQKR